MMDNSEAALLHADLQSVMGGLTFDVPSSSMPSNTSAAAFPMFPGGMAAPGLPMAGFGGMPPSVGFGRFGAMPFAGQPNNDAMFSMMMMSMMEDGTGGIAPSTSATSHLAQHPLLGAPSQPQAVHSAHALAAARAAAAAAAGLTSIDQFEPSAFNFMNLGTTTTLPTANEYSGHDNAGGNTTTSKTAAAAAAKSKSTSTRTTDDLTAKYNFAFDPFSKMDGAVGLYAAQASPVGSYNSSVASSSGMHHRPNSIKMEDVCAASPPVGQSLDEIMSTIQSLNDDPITNMSTAGSSIRGEHSGMLDDCLSEPLSPTGDFPDDDLAATRRNAHIQAEQKRRNNIKAGFDELQVMIPACQKSPASRQSKATVLHKAVDYIHHLVKEKVAFVDEINRLRKEVAALKLIIKKYQQLGFISETDMKALMGSGSSAVASAGTVAVGSSSGAVAPSAAGVAAASSSAGVGSSYADQVKFFIFCNVVDLLWESFSAKVSLDSPEEFASSIMAWFDEFARPDSLRESFLSSLRNMGTRFLTEESMQKVRRWSGGLSACTERITCGLEHSNLPMAQKLGETISGIASLFSYGGTKAVTSAPVVTDSPRSQS
ncbi:max-like protein X [Capsaspora owczarzaki ATCC 30864]|uniref:Max-like protein X n=1 Tax=Capsaspora owczarzaki (strain ATCC 30864) TaxID=595528 RepID=A0A0D2WVG6_CAPO3|nr:max-like protein X [Capsaspora owczarzaki ATCC 30864]KJE96168.1 max-like protein X [Capsaspora owczarzaki ATCC 30864]|eukprot:XP_004345278.1 max-like protein X [Capsaspora owczarzaki ATCC 30864]